MLLLDTNWGWRGCLYSHLFAALTMPKACPFAWSFIKFLFHTSIFPYFHHALVFILLYFQFYISMFSQIFSSSHGQAVQRTCALTWSLVIGHSLDCSITYDKISKFPNFHTFKSHISPAFHIFISAPFCCSDNAKGPCFGRVVIRHRFYKLPSVSQIFHTFVWLFVPTFCPRRLFVDSVSQPCQTIVKLRHSYMYYLDVHAYKQK